MWKIAPLRCATILTCRNGLISCHRAKRVVVGHSMPKHLMKSYAQIYINTAILMQAGTYVSVLSLSSVASDDSLYSATV